MYVCGRAPRGMCEGQRMVGVVWPSLHHVVLGVDLRTMRLGCKNFYLLSHLKASSVQKT